mmetsp:Transcript_4654/g.10279  ORF Transcript_4654/g.10279 Transcript_4654/m.10279 type:complete len:306 (+) Transcript_4654:43-960(+)
MRSALLSLVALASGGCTGTDCSAGAYGAAAGGNYRRTPNKGKLSLEEVSNTAEETEDTEEVAKTSGAKTLTFYMYRAQNQESYPIENNNLATLSGVMWYVHNEVVRMSCPRHYNINRILRFKVTMHNPEEVYNGWGDKHPQFGPFLAFDHGQCTVPNATTNYFDKYGYYVGCQTQHGKSYPGNVYWYSLPGPCPAEKLEEKSWWCKVTHPGGQCGQPDGGSSCTWHVDSAGEISLNELSGIADYDKFCSEHKREFVVESDKGVGLDFWNGLNDAAQNEKRVEAAKKLFLTKYPEQEDLATPPCEW